MSPALSIPPALLLLACGCATAATGQPAAASSPAAADAAPATVALGQADAEAPHCFRDAEGIAICPARGRPIPADEVAAAQMAARQAQADEAAARLAEDDDAVSAPMVPVLGE